MSWEEENIGGFDYFEYLREMKEIYGESQPYNKECNLERKSDPLGLFSELHSCPQTL
jgi:hypothetical protein